MKQIRTYEDFCNENLTNEEINLKKALAGVALGAGLVFSSPSKAQVPTPTQQEINSSNSYRGNFKWEKIDSVSKTKVQIYTDTKMFISEAWKSAKNVTQNDDKDAGIILVKGSSIKKVSMFMQQYDYVYTYNVTFKMKDGKYKVTIDNVNMESAIFMNNPSAHIVSIPPFEGEDNCPDTGTLRSPGPTKKKIIPMMESLKQDLQSIVDSYEKYIKNPSNTASGDW